MTEKKKSKDEVRVYCRRIGRMLPVSEHGRCPYCFGDEQNVEGGWYRDFCEYREGEDPIQFGFPPDSSRNTQG